MSEENPLDMDLFYQLYVLLISNKYINQQMLQYTMANRLLGRQVDIIIKINYFLKSFKKFDFLKMKNR